jgi:molecular chaperone GrpE
MSRKKRHKKNEEEETETVEIAAAAASSTRDEADDEHDDDETDEAASDPSETEQSRLDPAESELDGLAIEAREMRLLAQRKQAEFENYRKRIERERLETVKYAALEVVRDILPVLDNLERAVEAANQSAHSDGESQLREGVEIICKQFGDTLSKLGLAEVNAKNEIFDPHIHEAVTRVETDEYPEGTVVDVLQKGYYFKDRLLRPSMVSVSLPPGGDSSDVDQHHDNEDEAVRQGD